MQGQLVRAGTSSGLDRNGELETERELLLAAGSPGIGWYGRTGQPAAPGAIPVLPGPVSEAELRHGALLCQFPTPNAGIVRSSGDPRPHPPRYPAGLAARPRHRPERGGSEPAGLQVRGIQRDRGHRIGKPDPPEHLRKDHMALLNRRPRLAANVRRLGLGLVLLALSAKAQAGSADEYSIKAAYLYNFAKFVEWPGEAGSPGTPLVITVFGKDD